MKEINNLSMKEAKREIFLLKKSVDSLSTCLAQALTLKEVLHLSDEIKKETNHGWCIVILDAGFMYLGELVTDKEYLTIKDPSNIRRYTSGKGLLWHAENGPKDMILDSYKSGVIKAPYSGLKHFIPTDKKLWV